MCINYKGIHLLDPVRAPGPAPRSPAARGSRAAVLNALEQKGKEDSVLHRFEEITKWTLSEDASIFAYSMLDEELVYIVTDTVRWLPIRAP